jgi:predicted nuclease of restriction endonuclease-like (RecB) superfamily
MAETYREAVLRIKNAVLQSRYKAAASANADQLALYYGVGGYISANTRSGKWGTGAIEAISEQLQIEMPGLRGFSITSMKYMRTFYEQWVPVIEPNRHLPRDDFAVDDNGLEIRQLATAEFGNGDAIQAFRHLPSDEIGVAGKEAFLRVGFTHHREIIAKCKDLDERWYYILRCAAEFWSVEALKVHIKADDYRHYGKLPNNFALTMPDEKLAARAVMSFKDEYLLDYINIDDETDPAVIDEPVLSKAIVSDVAKFIMAMGKGFTYIGRNVRIIVDGEEFFCDLTLFNRYLNCLVVIELKRGKFKPSYLGQLSFYMSALDKLEKRPEENKSIGLLLCKEAKATTVELAIQDYNKPMGVATYKTTNDIPEPYKMLAPLVEGIQEIIANSDEVVDAEITEE